MTNGLLHIVYEMLFLGGSLSALCNITLLMHIAQINNVVNSILFWMALSKLKILLFYSIST